MFQLRKPIARASLFLILVIPFILSEISSGLEIYPAVLLPTGANLISTSDRIVVFRSSELVAIHSSGLEEILDPKVFFGDIPVQYWTSLANREFGFKTEERESLTVGLWTLSAVVSPQATGQQKQQLQEWMSHRLEALNLSQVSTLRVRKIIVSFDVNNKTEVAREVDSYFDIEID